MAVKHLVLFGVIFNIWCARADASSNSYSVNYDGAKNCFKFDTCPLDNGISGSNPEQFVDMRGEPGPEGPRGISGIPGQRGSEGEQGDNGVSGINGIPGPKGLPGFAVHISHEFDSHRPKKKCKIIGDDGKKMDDDIIKSCKYMKANQDSDGIYCISPKDSVIEAYCNKGNLTTCIRPKNIKSADIEQHAVNYNELTPFWLSTKGIHVTYEIPDDVLFGLQQQSFLVTQRIKIHCRNFFAFFNGKDYNSAVDLLTWNGIKIGPSPTETTPLFYSVESDGCKDANENSWKETHVTLQSLKTDRLPVIDVFIKDTRNVSQDVFIELGDLCFT